MIRPASLPLLAALTLLSAAEGPVPAQFRVWGTTFPGADEPLAMPARYQEVAPPEATALTPPAGHGLLPFRCHPQDLMHPRLVPGPAALADPALTTFAARGTYEALAIGFYAAETVRGLRAKLSPLAGPDGAILPVANLDLRWVRFMPNPVGRFAYRLDPLMLEKRTRQDLAGRTSVFAWITIATPADAVPGLYQGFLRLTADGQGTSDLPVRLRVLGFSLPPAEREFAMLYNPAFSARVQGEPARIREECVDMAEHGMNALAYLQLRPAAIAGADGTRTFTCEAPHSPIAGIVAAAMEAGLHRGFGVNWVVTTRYAEAETGHAWGTPACDTYLREAAQAFQLAARNGGWPPLTINIADEPNQDNPNNRTSTARHLAELVKSADPAIRTQGFCTGVYHQEDNVGALAPFLDVPVVMPFSADYLDGLRRRPQGFMLYNQAWPERPLDCRLAFGWMLLGTGARGVQQFMYRHLPGDRADPRRAAFRYWPEDGFTDLEPAWCYSWPGSDGLLPSPAFEAIRAGIDDLRYVQLAQALADTACRDAVPLRRSRGEQTLARLRMIGARLPTFLPSGAPCGSAPLAAAGAGTLDAARWEVASLILDLSEAVEPPAGGSPPQAACGAIRLLRSEASGDLPPPVQRQATAGPVAELDGFARLGDPSPGPALHPSSCLISYDSSALTLSCRAAEDHPGGPLTAPGTAWWDGANDRFEVFLASPAQDGVIHQLAGLADGRSGYVLHRRQVAEHHAADDDAVRSTDYTGLHVRAVAEPGGWRLLMTVPWRMLRLDGPPAPGEVWGLNICRSRAARPDGQLELSGWIAPERRFLEPLRLGGLAFASDPGLRGERLGIVLTDTAAIARLRLVTQAGRRETFVIPEIDGRGLSPVRLDLAAGRTETIVRLPALAPPCRVACRLSVDGLPGPLLAMTEVAGETAADLVIAGVGTRRAAWAGRPAGSALVSPAPGTVLTTDVRAFPVRIRLPGAATDEAIVTLSLDGSQVLRQEGLRLGNGEAEWAMLVQDLRPGRYRIHVAIGDLALAGDLQVVTGWLPPAGHADR